MTSLRFWEKLKDSPPSYSFHVKLLTCQEFSYPNLIFNRQHGALTERITARSIRQKMQRIFPLQSPDVLETSRNSLSLSLSSIPHHFIKIISNFFIQHVCLAMSQRKCCTMCQFCWRLKNVFPNNCVESTVFKDFLQSSNLGMIQCRIRLVQRNYLLINFLIR